MNEKFKWDVVVSKLREIVYWMKINKKKVQSVASEWMDLQLQLLNLWQDNHAHLLSIIVFGLMMVLNKIMMELVCLMINTLIMLTKSSSIALLVKKCLIMLGRDITAAFLLTDRQDQENLIRWLGMEKIRG
jgi:hypothetical protein